VTTATCSHGGVTGEKPLCQKSVDRKPSIGREYGAAFRKSELASPWVNKIEPREPRRQFVDDARRDHSPLAYSQILVCPETFAQRWKPSSQRVFRALQVPGKHRVIRIASKTTGSVRCAAASLANTSDRGSMRDRK